MRSVGKKGRPKDELDQEAISIKREGKNERRGIDLSHHCPTFSKRRKEIFYYGEERGFSSRSGGWEILPLEKEKKVALHAARRGKRKDTLLLV